MRMRRSRRHGMCDDEHVGGRDEDPCMISSTVCACAGYAAVESMMLNMLEGGTRIFNCMRMRRSRRHGMCDGVHVGGGDEDSCMITSTVCACAGYAAVECVMVNMLEGGTRILV
jgi:hypothetical protein